MSGSVSAIQENVRLLAGNDDLEMNPPVRRNIGFRRISGAAIKLPGGGSVHHERVLQGVQARFMRADIDLLVVSSRLIPEDDAREARVPVSGHVDLDDAILEVHVFEEGETLDQV